MIWTVLLQGIVGILNWAFSWLPVVTTLPLVDGYLSTGMGYVNFVATYIPPFGILLTGFNTLMIFKVTMYTLRLLRLIR